LIDFNIVPHYKINNYFSTQARYSCCNSAFKDPFQFVSDSPIHHHQPHHPPAEIPVLMLPVELFGTLLKLSMFKEFTVKEFISCMIAKLSKANTTHPTVNIRSFVDFFVSPPEVDCNM
jgi:hypothetical protein